MKILMKGKCAAVAVAVAVAVTIMVTVIAVFSIGGVERIDVAVQTEAVGGRGGCISLHVSRQERELWY